MISSFYRYLPALLVVVGALLRFLWLGDVPRGFFRDEAALGYNAYSIWLTGKDEYGISFPLFFRSFEVFFLPLYVYLSSFIIGLLGLSEFSTRFISALSGVFGLIFAYQITKKVWNKNAGVITLFILTIAPWHIFFSRGAFEGNLALTLFAGGFLFLLNYLDQQKPLKLILSVLLFASSMYSYQAERVVVPLFAVGALALLFKLFWKNRTQAIIAILVGFLVLAPLLSFTFKTAGAHRALGVSIFTKKPHGSMEQQDFFNSEIYLRSKQIFALYTSYFSPRNLFVEGDYDKQRSSANFSVLYSWLFPFFLIGVWQTVKNMSSRLKLLFIWILIAPIPSALTGDPFHTYRSLMLYLPLTILIGVGTEVIFAKLKGRVRSFSTLIFSGTALLSFLFFAYDYAVITSGIRARNWDHGYKEIFEYTKTLTAEKVVIHDLWTEPYIHYLFFNRIDPTLYHEYVYDLEKPMGYYYGDSSEIRPIKVSNYEFRLVDWPSERGSTGTVFIFDAEDLPESEFKADPRVQFLKEIKYPNGKIAYRIVQIK